MSKGNNNSYEGFRRKNSLNSHQSNNSNTSIDIFSTKIKKQDLKLVENLSLQLQNISKRSINSRSLGQNANAQTRSCNFINIYKEQALEVKIINKQRLESNFMQKVSFDIEDDHSDLFEAKKQKPVNFLAFNQFDVIQETRSFCQEEMIQDTSPAVLKHSLHDPLESKNKQLNKKNPKVAATPRPLYKKPAVLKNQILGSKKDKIKHDLSQLDKMQKQLEMKKVNRDNFTTKMLLATGVQKPKQGVNSQGLKDSQKLKSLANKDVKIQAFKPARSKSFKNVLPPKILQVKSLAKALQNAEEKVNEQQMVATRMLSVKEKSTLVNRLLELRQIIEKNEICSDSTTQITFHLDSIQKLLTQ